MNSQVGLTIVFGLMIGACLKGFWDVARGTFRTEAPKWQLLVAIGALIVGFGWAIVGVWWD